MLQPNSKVSVLSALGVDFRGWVRWHGNPMSWFGLLLEGQGFSCPGHASLSTETEAWILESYIYVSFLHSFV